MSIEVRIWNFPPSSHRGTKLSGSNSQQHAANLGTSVRFPWQHVSAVAWAHADHLGSLLVPRALAIFSLSRSDKRRMRGIIFSGSSLYRSLSRKTLAHGSPAASLTRACCYCDRPQGSPERRQGEILNLYVEFQV